MGTNEIGVSSSEASWMGLALIGQMGTNEIGLSSSEASLMGFALMGVIDLLFLVSVFLVMSPIFALRPASYAVMKRNFVNYFSNPTGYVFLCVFVLLTSFAAFWPHEFFQQFGQLRSAQSSLTVRDVDFYPGDYHERVGRGTSPGHR